MKKNCELMQDLLPLYADNACTEESRQIVAEHLMECEECKKLLAKMRQGISVEVEKDTQVIRRIKRKLRIEKTIAGAIIAVAALATVWMIGFPLLNTDQPMDYEKCNMAENVSVCELGDGELYLCCEGLAAENWFYMPELVDVNGKTIREEGFDKTQVVEWDVTLYERRINSLSIIHMEEQSRATTKYLQLFNTDEKENIQEVYYNDAKTGERHLLWTREELK